MGKYGTAAEIAARALSAKGGDPREAWQMAVEKVFATSESSKEKGCPRDSFLALCGMGLMRSVPSGEYTRSRKNRDYAARAMAEIRRNPELANDERALWNIVTDGSDKVPNHQMDVVTTLWRAGLVE